MHQNQRNMKQQLTNLRTLQTRVALFTALSLAALGIALGVYFYIYQDERDELQRQFDLLSREVLDSFGQSVERQLGAIDTLATSITASAMDANQMFPFVTVSNFAMRGSIARVLADALVMHWVPLVTDEMRPAWEDYAYQHRSHIDEAFEQDNELRLQQDEAFGILQEGEDGKATTEGGKNRMLQDSKEPEEDETATTTTMPPPPDPNVVPDGSGYHKQIFNIIDGSIRPNGTGPFLVAWQRSPIIPMRQRYLNIDWGNAPVLRGLLPILLEDVQNPKVILHRVTILVKSGKAAFDASLLLGQYRHNAKQYEYDPVSFLAYPVFDSFGRDKQLVGILASNLYWRLYFDNILPLTARGILVVMENSFNQTFAYEINGKVATFLGEGDPHDSKYDADDSYNSLKAAENVNTYIQSRARPETRAYTTVPLHDTYGQYRIHIYPTSALEEDYVTHKPVIYALVLGCSFLGLSLTFIIILSRALAQQANAKTEKNLTAYFAHELRNPLSAIDSALQAMPDDDQLSPSVRELIGGMELCTRFMTNLMNNLLYSVHDQFDE